MVAMVSTFRSMVYPGMLFDARWKPLVSIRCRRMYSHQRRRQKCKSARRTGTRVTPRGTNTGAWKGCSICMYTEPNLLEGIMNKIFADGARRVLVVTELDSENARGEGLRSKMDSIALNEFVFAPEKGILVDARETSLPPSGRAWSTHSYYVDGAQSNPTSDEALIQADTSRAHQDHV